MDREKVRQAVEEFAYSFVVAFALSFGAFLSGLSELPNMGEAKAAGAAAVTAGIVAVGKAVVWFFTGTKAPQ